MKALKLASLCFVGLLFSGPLLQQQYIRDFIDMFGAGSGPHISLLMAQTTTASITLSWGASTDAVGVTGYLIERCQGVSCTSFAQIASVSGTTLTYQDTGLASVTSYSYRARATDAAGNMSAYSNVATAVTSNKTPPTAPTNLTATPNP